MTSCSVKLILSLLPFLAVNYESGRKYHRDDMVVEGEVFP